MIQECHLFCIICIFEGKTVWCHSDSCLSLLAELEKKRSSVWLNKGDYCIHSIWRISFYMNWNFKIFFITNDTVMSPWRHGGTIWWSAQLTEGCWSIPEALQTQLSAGANSACGQHAADGVNHAIKWKIDLLCCHRDKLQYSLPIVPPEETRRGIF